MVKLAQAGVNTQDAEIMDCVERMRRVSWLERREETRSRKTLRAWPKAQSFLLWQCWALEESEGQGGARCYLMDQIGLQELTLLGEVGQVQGNSRPSAGLSLVVTMETKLGAFRALCALPCPWLGPWDCCWD